jgi:hypothetical protein
MSPPFWNVCICHCPLPHLKLHWLNKPLLLDLYLAWTNSVGGEGGMGLVIYLCSIKTTAIVLFSLSRLWKGVVYSEMSTPGPAPSFFFSFEKFLLFEFISPHTISRQETVFWILAEFLNTNLVVVVKVTLNLSFLITGQQTLF